MRTWIHYLPIATTLLAAAFAPQVLARWRARRPAPHLFWWGIGVVIYGLGAFVEATTTLLGWREAVFRTWYIAGALLGGAPLAQGTAYLLFRPRTANQLAITLFLVVLIAATGTLLSPIDFDRVETYRLSGQVLQWHWVRAFTPLVNSYAFVLLVGGAALSAWRYARRPGMGARSLANVLIALGGLLPGIGGIFTRFGRVEVLYVTELIGLVLIYLGYRTAIGAPRIIAAPRPSA